MAAVVAARGLGKRYGSRWALTAYLDVQNVYDANNPQGVQYNYNYTQQSYVSGFPILPSLGLRAEVWP